MRNKKKILLVLLGIVWLISNVTYTFAYFTVNQKVQNSVNLSIGNVNSNFIMVDEKTPCSSAIVNIKGLIPGGAEDSNFLIKNTGTLTSKIELCFDNFSGDVNKELLPYLSYKLVINNKVFEGRLQELSSKEQHFYLVDSNNNAILLKTEDMVKCCVTIKLDKNTPYFAQNKTLKFNLNIYATQPNDPNWVK